jgi:hypothetical protein
MAQDKNTQVATVTAPAKKISILAKMASRFSVEPDVLQKTLSETVFKGATNEQTVALLVVADQYGLNPFTKEIYAFPAKGGGIVPVVGIDGWLRIINEHKQFAGLETESDDDSCTCKIYRTDRTHPTIITEYLDECSRDTDPWRKAPKRMLRHKAIIQCARVAFSFAGIHDEDEGKTIADAEVISTTSGKPVVKEPKSKAQIPVAVEMTPAETIRKHAAELGFDDANLSALLSAEFSITDINRVTHDVVEVIISQLEASASEQ